MSKTSIMEKNWMHCFYNKEKYTTWFFLSFKGKSLQLFRSSHVTCHLISPLPHYLLLQFSSLSHHVGLLTVPWIKQTVPMLTPWHWLFILLEGILYWSAWLNPLPPPSLCSISPWKWGLPWLTLFQVAISTPPLALLIPYLDLLQKTNKWKYCIAFFTVWCRSWQPFPMKGQIIFYALWATQSVSW